MNKSISFLFFSAVLVFSLVSFADAEVDIRLSPAGSFKAKTAQIKGHATRKGDEVEAKNILVNLKSLKTGISLRDQHTLEYLNVKKYPVATLISAKGKDGKGEGVIKIKGIEKPISGTYEVKGESLIAKFPLKLSEFEITGIRYMGVGVKDEVNLTIEIPIK